MATPVNPKYPLFLREINQGNAIVGGYPVVTIKDNFNIEAKPNTFYNIKNNVDDEISINFKDEEFYNTGNDKILLFSFDIVDEVTQLFNIVCTNIGVSFQHNTSKEGYKYKSVLDLSQVGYGMAIIYTKEYPTTGKSLEICITNDVLGLIDTEITLTNVIVFNENIDTIVQVIVNNSIYNRLIIKEVENDNIKFKHKYYAYFSGTYNYVYSIEPYPNCSTIYWEMSGGEPDYEDAINVNIFKNPINISKYINEFVFNINSPANITFNNEIKWNNDNIPNLTKEGIYTISIVNGVGCYTFVNS